MPTLLEVIQAESALTAMVNQAGGPNCKGIADFLNDPSHGDTETVPRTMKSADLLGIVAPASASAAFVHPRFDAFRLALNAQDRQSVGEWTTAFAAFGVITDADKTAVFAYMAGTEEQPISRAQKQLGRAVNVQEIFHALTGN